jgi:hypothetical protein
MGLLHERRPGRDRLRRDDDGRGLESGRRRLDAHVASLFRPQTIPTQSPLNARRSAARSGSWLLGSPLPTPMILAGPVTRNVTWFMAIGTIRPSASAISTTTIETSSPSALMRDDRKQ